MSIRSGLGAARRLLLSSFNSRPVQLIYDRPIVSFCFDDFPRTAYLSGAAILKSFGARGTYYAAAGLIDTCTDLGEQFTLSDLESLLANGHEVGCHTFSHISCRNVSMREFASDVRKGREAVLRMTGWDPGNFAYPFGHVTMAAKKTIGSQMKSCRGIYGGVNQGAIDLNLLRANSLYGNLDKAGEYEALFRLGKNRNSWLIFYTHDVRENPSPFGCTPALLEKTVSLAVANGFHVAPVRDVVDRVEGIPDLIGSRNNTNGALAKMK
jgi:peptidoglycan/xylan/chitin deacetylase (PgdA/CDA1 family)